MTGYDEAREWLASAAPDWRIQHADSALQPGPTAGSPTQLRTRATLVQTIAIKRGETVPEYLVGSTAVDMWLTGEGATILEAVQAAVGGLG